MVRFSSRRIGMAVKIVFVVLFLASLWVYQLPISPVERILMVPMRPLQKLFFTDRQYQMYAPDPLSIKKISFILLKNKKGGIEFLKSSSRNPLTREKWNNFIYQLGRSLAGDLKHYPSKVGQKVFEKLAMRLCQERELKSVEMHYRPVHVWELREEIVWKEPSLLEQHMCEENPQ